MSLFSTLQIANNALTAQQLGLQVTGNNVANANTPGYVRQQLVLAPAATSRQGSVLLGLGVDVKAVIQKTDRFLEERLREAAADVAGSEAQESVYSEIEALVGELGTADISTSLTRFFGSVHDILNQPESRSVRNVVVQTGKTLTSDLQRLDERIREVRRNVNDRVKQAADTVNNLTAKLADLNVKIVNFEGGGLSLSEAAGLRDERTQTANELARLLGTQAFEQTDGSLSVFLGGDFLVLNGTARKLTTTYTYDRELATARLQIADTTSDLDLKSGEVLGQTVARDQVLGGLLDSLDGFAKELIHEFNRVYSSGQGLVGYDRLTSEFAVADTSQPLDQAGLKFSPENGEFQLHIRNKQTGQTTSHSIAVSLNGLDDDTSLDSLAQSLDAISGLQASITADRRLKLDSEGANFEFSFSDDSSGVLTGLGINTFFSGSSISNIGVQRSVQDDPAKFAASRSGIAADTENAVVLAAFLDRPLDNSDGQSLADIYESIIGNVSQSSASSQAAADGFRVFHATIESQFLSVTSVSLDEEAVRMLSYQRAYQASARLVKVVDELLQTLVNL